MADDDSGMTQRERRREQYKKNKPTLSMSAQTQKRLLIGGFIVLVLGGVVTGMVLTAKSGDDCPGHWHATFQVWVDDEMVTSYAQYNLENGRLPISMHMHRGEQTSNPYQIHFEPNPSRCIPFSDFLSRVDTDISSGRLVLDGLHEATPQGGTHEAGGNQTLQLFHKTSGGDWQSISARALNDRQLRDGERVLILFGDYSEERVAAIQGGVAFPSATGTDPDHG